MLKLCVYGTLLRSSHVEQKSLLRPEKEDGTGDIIKSASSPMTGTIYWKMSRHCAIIQGGRKSLLKTFAVNPRMGLDRYGSIFNAHMNEGVSKVRALSESGELWLGKKPSIRFQEYSPVHSRYSYFRYFFHASCLFREVSFWKVISSVSLMQAMWRYATSMGHSKMQKSNIRVCMFLPLHEIMDGINKVLLIKFVLTGP